MIGIRPAHERRITNTDTIFISLDTAPSVWPRPRICQGGRVSESPALGDVAGKATHDFATARLGKLRSKEDLVGSGDGADLLRHVILWLV